MLLAVGIRLALAAGGLAVDMAGYASFGGVSAVDAYVEAATILAGIGPMGQLKTAGGKIFAGSYAIFSGLIVIVATGFALAPIFRRVLHRFHVEDTEEGRSSSQLVAMPNTRPQKAAPMPKIEWSASVTMKAISAPRE
jgi:hypothetical protein